MKVLVTGASGFLGRAVVRAAVAAGHDVIAMVRPTADVDMLGWSDTVEIVRGDLRQNGDWQGRIGHVDAVIHLAAASSGDLAHQFAGTVVATENLLASLPLRTLRRFVHVSSFSVYDYAALPAGATIDESAPLEARPDRRDAYTTTKMFQERLVVEACVEAETFCIILRPGAIYGPGKAWDFGRALKIGRFDIIVSPRTRFRLTFVDNCADAIVRAVAAPAPAGVILNIVDDDLPTHGGFHALCKAAGNAPGPAIWVPWLVLAAIGRAVDLLNRLAFKGRAKLPEILALHRQQARWKPFAYNNNAAKNVLGWTPRTSFKDGITLTMESENKLRGRDSSSLS